MINTSKGTYEATQNKPFPANLIIISTSAAIGEHTFIMMDFLSNQRFTCLTLKKEYRIVMILCLYFTIVLL
ncbi:MAG: restriction endonuclease subunit S [Ruminococcus sp.]|nr:restriction endonuclease subunit S [Ruminococcus sp.]